MNADDDIGRKAMTAMKAVTAGALLFAGVACSSDTDDTGETWNVAEQDDAGDSDTGNDVGDVDTGPVCNAQESTGVCPDGCTMDNDVDCCEEIDSEWEWCDWVDDYCSCAIMGPFVPPSMPRRNAG